MIEIALFIGVPVVVVIGFVAWRLGFDRGVTRLAQAPIRRREDARDWQQRFGAESLLSENFFPPTQNEILETLYILDHLTPRWEIGGTASAERAFLNELALNFPTLRKADGAFPAASTDGPEARETSARREAFRTRDAQFNALDQIISGAPAPGDPAPGDLPLGRPTNAATATGKSGWPLLLAGAAVTVAAVLAGLRFFPGMVDHRTPSPPAVAVAPADNTPEAEVPALPEPTPAVAAAIAAATPAPATLPSAPVVEAKPIPVPRATPSQTAAVLEQQIVLSKQRAVDKYPSLAVEGSEINLRFVFRYKNLVKENSPRLREPNWPEQLVEECAAAAGVSAKHGGFTRVLGLPR